MFVYVNDCVVTGNNNDEINLFARIKKGIYVSQFKGDTLLISKETQMLGCKLNPIEHWDKNK